jgi:DNA ligase-1
MKNFSRLIWQLSSNTSTSAKLEVLGEYFRSASDADKVWVIALFTGRRPRGIVKTSLIRECCLAVTGLPEWLFEESYHTVGDLAETISLLLPEQEDNGNEYSLNDYMTQLLEMRKQSDEVKKEYILAAWNKMNRQEIFVFNKLITGGFRIGVSQKTMVNALALVTNLPAPVIAHRISGSWDPAVIGFSELLNDENNTASASKPYPFYLAYALDLPAEELGDPNAWQAEWKWDGIRGQIIRRNNEMFVWSRGEELITEKFPELNALLQAIPDGTVIDGEIISIAHQQDAIDFKPGSFATLQTRISRKTITRKQLTEAPVGFIAYDIMEVNGTDCRELPLMHRRSILESLVAPASLPFLYLSPLIEFSDWEMLTKIRSASRDRGTEGLMLKRKNSVYETGRKKGDWWKWKIDPLTIDAVMIYAQKGHGRRSGLYTDYTFAVKDGDKLVPFAKAYSGLTDREFAQVDAFVKRNSLEKFGPVRTVKPELVFELAFEGIAASNRHKSGVALRFPRMSRWRKDKTVAEINTIEDLRQMLNTYGKQ